MVRKLSRATERTHRSGEFVASDVAARRKLSSEEIAFVIADEEWTLCCVILIEGRFPEERQTRQRSSSGFAFDDGP